jgi:outer membrane protein OmpA-like peptidoglycan-associated protein
MPQIYLNSRNLKSWSFFLKTTMSVFLIALATNVSFSQAVHITGSFWDDSNGVDLKTQVYGIKGGQKIHLAETGSKNLFDFQLPTDIQTIVFGSEGYNPVSFPVNFVGRFDKTSSANISINSKGGFSQYKSKDLIMFCLPSTHQKGNKYELFTVRKDTLFRNMDFTILVENKLSSDYLLPENFLRNNYKVVTSNSKSEIIQENDFFAKKGLTFVDINAYPNEKVNVKPQEITLSENSYKEVALEPKFTSTTSLPYDTFGRRILYFDQSKFELKSENQLVLDSLALYLKAKMSAKISVEGYTDNVGSEALNATLAKYRASVVANYLKNKGVGESQLQLRWASKSEATEGVGGDLSKQRKVQLIEIF